MREELRKIALELNTEKTSSFQSVAQTKEKVIEGALSSYAKGCPKADILAVMDTTVFGGGKSGFVLTEKKLYSSHFIRHGGADKRFVPLEGLVEAKYDLKHKNLYLRYDDGCLFGVYASIYTDYLLKFLHAVIALKGNKDDQAVEEKPAGMETLTEQENVITQNVSEDEECLEKENDEAIENVRTEFEEERKALEEERKALEEERKALEKERKAFVKDQKALEKERKAFVKDQKALERERKALEKERKALEKEKKTFEKERKAFEQKQDVPEQKQKAPEEQPEEKVDRDTAKERFMSVLKSSQDPDELYKMGKHCEKGDGYERYFSKAADFYEKAAKKGHADAQLSLGILYLYGLGIEKNLEKAKYWGEKAEAGNCSDTLSLEALLEQVEMKRQVRKEIY